jgi:hypothetical protein
MRDFHRRYVLPTDHPLPGNLAALWTRDVALAREVERRLGEHPAKGSCTPAIPLDFDPCETFAIACLGFNATAQAAFDRTGSDRGEGMLAIFEPDLDAFVDQLWHHDWTRLLKSPRVALLVGQTALEPMATAEALRRFPLTIALGVTLIDGKPDPDAEARIRTILDDLTDQQKTHVGTTLRYGRKSVTNVLENLPDYASNAGIARLKDAFAGKPAVLVSAGPSLQKNVEQLRGREHEVLIIAVQTAIKPLLDAGVVPHFACSIDHHEISTRFYADLPEDLATELVVDPKASPATIAAWKRVPGRKLTLLGNHFAERAVRESAPGLPTLPSTATVAHLAFELAGWMGCGTAILIGQDLGFSDGLAYAPGTGYDDAWRPETGRFCTFEMKQWEHIARDRHALLQVPDYRGNPTYTERRLAAYLSGFERLFADSSMRVIDATEGGVAKRHAEVMPLAEALDQARTSSTDFAAAPEHPVESRSPGPMLEEAARRRIAEARVIIETVDRTEPLLASIRDDPTDVARVNEAVGRIDTIRRRLTQDPGVDQTYRMAAELTQESERDRYLADLRVKAVERDETERVRRQCDRDLANIRAMRAAAEDLIGLMRPFLPPSQRLAA